jgi:hypothetical protein
MNKALPNKVHFVGTFSTFLIEIIMGTKKSVRDDICQQSSKERKSDIKYHLFVRFFVQISLNKFKKKYNLGEKFFHLNLTIHTPIESPCRDYSNYIFF